MAQYSAAELGNFLQREPGSHAFTMVPPSTVTETQPTQVLFQQPPSHLFLPPIFVEGQAPPKATASLRHSWHASRQGLHREEVLEPSLQTLHFGRLEVRDSEEVSSRTSQDCTFVHSWGVPFHSGIKREEIDFVSLSRHPHSLAGISGNATTPMSDHRLYSSELQDHSIPSESVTEPSMASSSRLVTSPIPKLRRSAIGGYLQPSVLDTSVGEADFTQSGDRHSPAERHAVAGITNENQGDVRKNYETGPQRSKKQRTAKARERVRIALAPDQPPTTQGKQRERVYVACQQCRNRKIRCDGAKPMCYNCNQRGTGICEFDSIPKRRGPDRHPGSRQRHGKMSGSRRRRTRSDKQEARAFEEDDLLHSAARSVSESTTVPSNDHDTTWPSISSPPPLTSTDGYRYETAPGSSGSDTSQAHPDYRSLLAPSFAYNAPRDGHVIDTVRYESDPRTFVSRISTDQIALNAPGPLSGTLSPETPSSIPYSTVSTSFGAPSNTYANTSSPVGGEETYAGVDNMPKSARNMSLDSLSFGDSISRESSSVQPIVLDQSYSLPSAYSNMNIYATQQSGNSDYLPVSDTRITDTHCDNTSNVNPDSYNPYQWAVHQIQYHDVNAAYVSSSEDEEGVVPYEFTISQPPSLDFVRKTWWDSLLDTYCAEPYCTPTIVAHYQAIYGVSALAQAGTIVAGSARQRVAQIIVHDLQSTFKDSNYMFAFFNIRLFFKTLFKCRETMQPALVLALLMWSNYLRSSMVELASEGLRRTLWLKEKAQAALDASVNSSWVDSGLAQAAWLITLFELSSQPSRSVARMHSALTTLDNIIHALSLTYIDADDLSVTSPPKISSAYRSSSANNGSISHLVPILLCNPKPIAEACPKVKYPSQLLQYHSPHRDSSGTFERTGSVVQPPTARTVCICNDLALGKNWQEAKDYVPFWVHTPAWNPAWSDAEIRREECRRLCWNALNVFAGYTTYRTSVGLATLDLFLLHPSNVHNILPGENLTELSPSSIVALHLDTVWALYVRAILLWHACLRIRNVSERERAIFARTVWMEADAIENALDGHTCSIERAMLYQGREYLFNTRMYVSSEFRRFVPHPSPEMSGAVHRRMAEEWLTHQSTLAKRAMHGLQSLTGLRGNVLAKRPFFCYWFMGQLSRCLQLWQADKSLTTALEGAKNFLSPINYLSALWPCDEQRGVYSCMRDQLENACREAGLAPPPLVDPTFPLPTNLISLP